MNNIYSILILVIFLFHFEIIIAQSSISVAGGYSSNNEASVDYVVGQMFYNSQMGSVGTITEGIQQPYEIFIQSRIENEVVLECLVYPNPVFDYLYLSVNSNSYNKLSYKLFDIKGGLIKYEIIEKDGIEIPTLELLPSIYFLKIFEDGKDVMTFKIVKNDSQ